MKKKDVKQKMREAKALEERKEKTREIAHAITLVKCEVFDF